MEDRIVGIILLVASLFVFWISFRSFVKKAFCSTMPIFTHPKRNGKP